MRTLLLGLIAIAGCSKAGKADECQRVTEKSKAVLGEIARMRGVDFGADAQQKLVTQCRDALAKGNRDPSMDCVLAAKDDAAVRDCYMKGFEAYRQRGQAIEAKVTLNMIGKLAGAQVVARGAFPAGKVGPTPATACCSQPDQQCAVDAAAWADPVWQALGYEPFDAGRFQYSYASDGQTFTATAVGDVGCTGKPVTHTATGKIVDGAPQIDVQ